MYILNSIRMRFVRSWRHFITPGTPTRDVLEISTVHQAARRNIGGLSYADLAYEHLLHHRGPLHFHEIARYIREKKGDAAITSRCISAALSRDSRFRSLKIRGQWYKKLTDDL
jgi:hypothetical protein